MEKESRITFWKNRFGNEAAIIALSTGLAYAGTFLFEIGIASYFDIPFSVISIDIGPIIIIAVFELIILACLSLVAPAMYSATTWIRVKTRFPLVEVVLLPAVVVGVWLYPKGDFANGICNLAISLITLVVALSSNYGDKERSSIMPRFDAIFEVVCAVFFLISFLTLFYSFGRYTAETHQSVFVASFEGKTYFFIDKFGDTFVLKAADLATKTYSPETILLRLEDGKPLSIRRERNLHLDKSVP